MKMKFIVNLIISMILISFTLQDVVIKEDCDDRVCQRLCQNKFYNGKRCNIGYCFETGNFCHCKYAKLTEEYHCDNVKVSNRRRRKYRYLLKK